MRIAVLSDSHGYYGRLSSLLMMMEERGPLDAIFHLGDGSRDLAKLDVVLPPVYQVAGNCDFMQPGTLEVVEMSKARMLLTHGHIQGVKQSLDSLLLLAMEHKVRTALYGHTHVQRCEERNGILLLNPGSAMDGHCALLEISWRGDVTPTLY